MKLEPKIMINWLIVESALMSTSPNMLGPINMPNSRNTTTSGTFARRAIRPENVPTARIAPNINIECLASSSEADDSTVILDYGINELNPSQRVLDGVRTLLNCTCRTSY